MSARSFTRTSVCSSFLTALLGISACTSTAPQPFAGPADTGRDSNRLLVVDCLLPGQLRRLGGSITFLTPRRPTKVSASECEIRGGEYVAYDRANFATSLKVWLPKAQTGDVQAQTMVGEIFEKGLGQVADPTIAAEWYRKAAAQGYSRALINLGYLYESGLGVERDLTRAMNLYRQAAGFGDGTLEYVTSVQTAAREQQARDNSALRQEVENANSALGRERQTFSQLQSQYSALEQQAISLRSELTLSESKPEDKSEISALLSEMQALKRQLDTSSTDSARLVSELETQQQQTGNLRQRVSVASKQLFEAQDELAEQTTQIEYLQVKLADQLAVAAKDKSSLVADLEKQLETSVASREVLQQQVEKLEENQSGVSEELRNKLKLSEKRESLLISDLDKTRSTLSDLQVAIESKDSDYRNVLDMLSRSEAGLQNRVQKQQFTIDGLESRIAEFRENAESQKDLDKSKTESQMSELRSELDSARAELIRIENLQQASEENHIDKLSRVEKQLKLQRERVAAQQKELDRLQREAAAVQATRKELLMDDVSADISLGPVIEIIEPPVTIRDGVMVIPVIAANNSIEVIGRVSPADELFSFSINGSRQEFNDMGMFQHVAAVEFSSSLAIAAVDHSGVSGRIQVELERQPSAAVKGGDKDADSSIDVSQVDFGEYHALVIGNGNYSAMPHIETAVNDATEMARTLAQRFGFKTELILDADRYDILAALNRKRDELTSQDNLVIFFSGHGEIGNGKGYWLPIDADPGDKNTWISNVSVAAMIDAMSAKHVMIVADSVFSGTLSRSSLIRMSKAMDADLRLSLYKIVANSKVRTVLTSGAVRPFNEGAHAGEHSVFTSGVLKELNGSGPDVLFAYDLFVKIREQLNSVVTPTGATFLTQYAPIKYAGHESGEFLFVPVENRVSHESMNLPSRSIQRRQELLLEIKLQGS